MTARAEQSDTIPAALQGDHVVTSSDLVRHFGVWQERAARTPVYILHRGRPRFVMTSIDVMNALCAPHLPGATPAAIDAAALLDGIRDMVIVADAGLDIIAASRAARARFGSRAAIGASLLALCRQPDPGLYEAAIFRVMQSGMSETIDLPDLRYPARRLTIMIEPHATGIALFVQDATAASELRAAEARCHAAAESLAVLDGVATARISPRGFLEQPDAGLAALVRRTPDSLAGLRFEALIDSSARAAMIEAIDGVIADGTPRSLSSMLLANHTTPIPIKVGLAAYRPHLAVDGVTATLVIQG
ncbi:hypothetical protein ABC974_18995 [Sphingomonas oligophenolica]|uniref:PAS domain-containing protein n=1 Tax=Sphingomonas oligophenolica TaxID=301154 RepID=A0ABU9Y7I3_9SPHN